MTAGTQGLGVALELPDCDSQEVPVVKRFGGVDSDTLESNAIEKKSNNVN